MTPRIIFVELKNHLKDKFYPNFFLYHFEDQLKFLVRKIKKTCEALKAAEPQAMWILLWREHGITNGLTKFLLPDQKKLFKEALQKLTMKYPQLAIIAGTISTAKRVDQFINPVISKTLQAYQENSDLCRFESAQEESEFEPQFKDHIQQVENAYEKKLPEIKLVRNTCFVFQGKQIWKHDKCAPYNEVLDKDKLLLEGGFFKPGHGDRRNPIVKLSHPFSDEEVSLGIELCREHTFSFLEMYADQHRLPLPRFQVILANSSELEFPNIVSDYVILSDSYHDSQFIQKDPKKSCPFDLLFYSINLFSNDGLEDPKKPNRSAMLNALKA